jgi:hypothetical protein
MGKWLNPDGLYLKTGTDEGVAGIAGTFADPVAGAHVTEITGLDLTTLTTSPVVIEDGFMLPKDAVIQKVDVIATTAGTSGGSATFDLGLIRSDRTTELDYNGILAAVALTDVDALGETHSYTGHSVSNGIGALGAVELPNDGYLTANYTTAAFETGIVTIRIYWVMGQNR